MVLTPQDFEREALAFPQLFLSSILEAERFCNPIQQGNFPSDWLQQPKVDRTQQGRDQAQAQGTPGDAPRTGGYQGDGMTSGRDRGNGMGGRGHGQGGGRGGGLGSPFKQEVHDGRGGMQGGGYPRGACYQWLLPTNDPMTRVIQKLPS
jgi:hypothetical protein